MLARLICCILFWIWLGFVLFGYASFFFGYTLVPSGYTADVYLCASLNATVMQVK